MKIVSSSQMKQLDKIAMGEYSIPGIVLMENAGLKVFYEVLKVIEKKENKKVLVVCGRGNNGGDGFVVARHLLNAGIPVKVFLVGDPSGISGDAKINYEILRKLNMDIEVIGDDESLQNLSREIQTCSLIVDAIFGTGIVRKIEGLIEEVIHMINESQKEVMAIDIPSGVSGEDGSIYGTAIKANKTIMIQLPKIGNINYPGAGYGGQTILKDIGIPEEAMNQIEIHTHLITKSQVRDILPIRKQDTHKGDYGKAFIVAGSIGMTGAAMLICGAALKSGAGLLKIAIPQSLDTIIETKLTEAITVPLPELKKGTVGISDIDKILDMMTQADVIAIGPGSGKNRGLEEVIRNIIEHATIPIVLDADALNALSKRKEILSQFKTPVVMTPHVGEMARLTGLDTAYINTNRIKVATEFAKRWHAMIVLKGARTVIADPSGEIYLNQTGNPGMATAGSGDVLTGIVTSFIAQGIEPMKAAIAAVYIHGMAGDRAVHHLGEYGLMAGDIVREVPFTIKEIIGR
jgi:hydroxyethylthiazole kinase-like uncharacterized protein yjeF